MEIRKAMHVLTPQAMELLGQVVAESPASNGDAPIMLTPAPARRRMLTGCACGNN